MKLSLFKPFNRSDDPNYYPGMSSGNLLLKNYLQDVLFLGWGNSWQRGDKICSQSYGVEFILMCFTNSGPMPCRELWRQDSEIQFTGILHLYLLKKRKLNFSKPKNLILEFNFSLTATNSKVSNAAVKSWNIYAKSKIVKSKSENSWTRNYAKTVAISAVTISTKHISKGMIAILKELLRDLLQYFDAERISLKQRRAINPITTAAAYWGSPRSVVSEIALKENALEEIMLISIIMPPLVR